MMTPFSFALQHRPKKRSNLVLARNVLKHLLAVKPPPTVEQLREQGKEMVLK